MNCCVALHNICIEMDHDNYLENLFNPLQPNDDELLQEAVADDLHLFDEGDVNRRFVIE